MLDDKGNPVIGASGQPAMMPQGTTIQSFAAKGETALQISPFLPTMMLYDFKIGGAMDLQRLSGHFEKQFTDSATIAIGVFSAAGKVPFNTVMGIMDAYAGRNSHFQKGVQMDSTFTHLPATNVMNTRIGFDLYQSGRVTPQMFIPVVPREPVF